MQVAGNYLLGTHDFSAFRASSCQANTPVRTMDQFKLSQSGAEVTVECSANAFLHHMVRNIVGSLVKVGLGEAAPEWVAELLDSRDRKLSGITAPACGLALTRVDYPSEQL